METEEYISSFNWTQIEWFVLALWITFIRWQIFNYQVLPYITERLHFFHLKLEGVAT